MEKSKTEIEKEIIDFLDTMSTHKGTPGKGCGLNHGSSLVLATCRKNVPRATTLDFFNEGLTLYIFGEPGGKLGNIRTNPRVSAAIYQQPLDHSKHQRALQIWGKARLITRNKNKKLFEDKAAKWGLSEVARVLVAGNLKKKGIPLSELDAITDKVFSGLTIIKIDPDKIILRTFTPEFGGEKLTWTKR